MTDFENNNTGNQNPAQQPPVQNNPYQAPPQSNQIPPYAPNNQNVNYSAYTPEYSNQPPHGYSQKSRLAAGLLAIMLGAFGIHNFYLGYNTKAIVQLLITLLTCGIGAIVVTIWTFIEGILILSANQNYLYDSNGIILRD